jgi:hypothetical protein
MEAETIEELGNALDTLGNMHKGTHQAPLNVSNIPEIPSMLGCTDAVRTLMETSWGKTHRTMTEIKSALEANQLFFSKEALSATLVTLTKKNEVQRIKEEGKWKYSKNSSQGNP